MSTSPYSPLYGIRPLRHEMRRRAQHQAPLALQPRNAATVRLSLEDGQAEPAKYIRNALGGTLDITWQVLGGPYHGLLVKQVLRVDVTNPEFRRLAEVAAEIDMKSGGKIKLSQLIGKLAGTFDATIIPEERNGANTGRTVVVEIHQRVS